jgi:hypothetical protein
MKADIIIPEVENIFVAAVQEWSDDFMEKVWYAYLVNDSDFLMESVMVVSKAFGTIDGEMKKTSLLRHAFVEVPAVSVVKIEMLEKSVLVLNNELWLRFSLR